MILHLCNSVYKRLGIPRMHWEIWNTKIDFRKRPNKAFFKELL